MWDDDSGYDLNDPKHPTFHERYADVADLKQDQRGVQPTARRDTPEKGASMTTKYKPEPGKIVVVTNIPECNFCGDGTPGPYDFATRMGPWANGCEQHWEQFRVGPLGTGSGQLWITADQADC